MARMRLLFNAVNLKDNGIKADEVTIRFKLFSRKSKYFYPGI